MNLIEALKNIKDFRRKDGRRHEIWLVLLIVIMGTMSGYLGYRALGDFVEKHRAALIKLLKVPKNRLPSYSTIRRVMMGIDFEEFIAIFNKWAMSSYSEAEQWYSIDGKTLRGSGTNLGQSYHQFVQIVSVFSAQTGIVRGMSTWLSKKNSEIVIIQNLIKVLQLEGVVFTLDALNCQKKLLR